MGEASFSYKWHYTFCKIEQNTGAFIDTFFQSHDLNYHMQIQNWLSVCNAIANTKIQNITINFFSERNNSNNDVH